MSKDTNKGGHELVDALDDLDTLDELHNDPTVNYRRRCPAGTKAVGAACIGKEEPVAVNLPAAMQEAVSAVRNRLMARHAVSDETI
jgi:hypothetical protein